VSLGSVGVGVSVSVGTGVEVSVGTGVEVSVGTGVEVSVGNGDGVSVGTGVGVSDGVLIGVGVAGSGALGVSGAGATVFPPVEILPVARVPGNEADVDSDPCGEGKEDAARVDPADVAATVDTVQVEPRACTPEKMSAVGAVSRPMGGRPSPGSKPDCTAKRGGGGPATPIPATGRVSAASPHTANGVTTPSVASPTPIATRTHRGVRDFGLRAMPGR
jgi:hypothetical protein